MHADRRKFLLGAAALAASAHAQSPLRPPPRPARDPFTTPLRLPSASGLFALVDAGNTPLRLAARIERQPIFPGRLTDLFAYRADAGGKALFNPLLRARTGDGLDVTLANHLGEETTIHWHGLQVDERNDGSGMHPVRHDTSYVYRFRIANRAGLYWYHPHPHDRTGAQIHKGLGSLLLVQDEEDDALRRALGLELGRTEIPLLIQDKQVDDLNRIHHAMGEDDWIGNRMLVNWTPEPFFDATTCLHRFRILNGSNARTYLLAFTQAGRRIPYTLIGTDGGLLEKPATVTQCFLAPAQRLDVLVDFEKLVSGSTVMLTSLAYDPMENDGRPGDPAMEHPGAPALGSAQDILKINVKVPVCAPRAVPKILSSLSAAPGKPVATRKFRLHIEGVKWLINGYNYHDDMRAVQFGVARGSVEHWEISNDMKSMPHPMHLHGFQFRVVERRKSPAPIRRMAVTPAGLSPQDLGWQDTVLVWPGETVRIAIDFSQPFEGTQQYMFHCHNLEHEDQGMMMNFEVRA
jgi:blue copper oxidase